MKCYVILLIYKESVFVISSKCYILHTIYVLEPTTNVNKSVIYLLGAHSGRSMQGELFNLHVCFIEVTGF